MNESKILKYIKKSFELRNKGYYKPAIEMLYKALTIDCDNLEILAQLAHLYKLLKNYPRAIYYVEKVLDSDSKHLDCLFLLKDIYLQQNNLEKASNISETIYKIQPTCSNLATRINILNRLGDFNTIKEIENFITNQNDSLLFELASAYYGNCEFDKALEFLESGYKLNNKNEQIMFLLAKIHYENKEFEKSKEIFNKLAQTNPNAEIMNYLGLFELNKNDFTNATDYFLHAHKLDAQNAEYTYNLASAYFLNGWLDEALKYFNKAICLDSDNINYHYSLAYLYYQRNMYDKSLLELKFIRTTEQNHTPSNVLNAMIIAKKGDLLDAKNQLNNIIKYAEKDDFIYFALSEIYKELSQLDLAKITIEKALSIKPENLNYISSITGIELKQENYNKALKLAQSIIKLNNKYVYGYIALAKINYELKKFDKVFDAAQEIIKLDLNSPEGYYYNAIALFEKKDETMAIESLKKSISLDPNNSLLYIKMSEFYQNERDFNTAYEWAKEASEIDPRNYKNKWLCAKLAVAIKNSKDAIKYYSQSYRLGSFDKELGSDYSNYLMSIGKEKQAKKISK